MEETPAPPDDGVPPSDDADAFYAARAAQRDARNSSAAHAEKAQEEPRLRPKAIDWVGWRGRTPPAREWWQQDWLGPDPHLVSGAGGIGKSLFLQTMGTAVALGRELLGVPTRPLRVLLWLCEDLEHEIVRRQDALCAHFGIERESLQDKLIIEPRVGFDNTLFAALEFGKVGFTPEYFLLREQVNDLGIDLLGLDNIGQVYGANENDRHQVTVFVNGIRGLVRGRPFAPLFVGHVARTAGSEFSGSAAWENACRMRWYMGTRLPDQKPDADDDEPTPSDIVYLAKRKANYTEKDYRRLRYANGVLAPEVTEGRRFDAAYRDDIAEQVILKAFDKLKANGIHTTDAKNSGDFLPSQIKAKGYAEGYTKVELAKALNRLIGAGKFKRGQIGTYPSSRHPRMGLVRNTP